MTSVHKFNTVTLKDIPITIAHNVDNRRGIFATGDIRGGTTIMKIHSNDIIRGKKEELHKVSNETMTAWKKDLPDMTFPVEWDTDKKDQLSCSPMRILLEQKAQQFIGPPGYVKLRSFIGSRCFFDGKEIRNQYLIVKDGQLAGMGAHSYSKGSATGGSEEAAKYKKK